MINGYWGYNAKENKYEKTLTEPFSLFPTIVEPKRKIVFCRKCHRWEYIISFCKNCLITQCGKSYSGPFVLENAMVVYCYDVQKIKNTYCVKVKAQKASLTNRRLFEINYLLDFEKKILYKDGKSVFENEDLSEGICKEITEEIINEMGCIYKEKYGIKPTISSKLKGFNVVVGYMLSPFNVNFYKIAQHWGLNPYDKDFITLSSGDTPTAENEMFESLDIKPTKKLRKIYQQFPQSVICYAMAKDLGFTDVNILQKSVSIKFYVFAKFFMISFAGGEISYPMRDALKSFTQDMLHLAKEKTVWNSIERTVNYFTNKNSHDYIVSDGLQTYFRLRLHLTENEKREIMKEGFNEYTHDYLVRRANIIRAERENSSGYKKTETNVIFNIEPEFLALEYKAGDDKKKIFNAKTQQYEIVDRPDEERYCFYVARDSETLRKIGSAMHNCVGWGYANSVEKRRCTIVYAMYNNYCRICIEVTPQFTIRQSLGPCNQPLCGPELQAYHEWCKEKGIIFKKAFHIHVAM